MKKETKYFSLYKDTQQETQVKGVTYLNGSITQVIDH